MNHCFFVRFIQKPPHTSISFDILLNKYSNESCTAGLSIYLVPFCPPVPGGFHRTTKSRKPNLI